MEPSWLVFVGGPIAGFGPNLFDTPTELELSSDGLRLYVSDYGNNRIRVVNTITKAITTVVGNGMPCWRFGPLPTTSGGVAKQVSERCNGYDGEATAQRPMGLGLSRDNKLLYAAMLSEDGVVRFFFS